MVVLSDSITDVPGILVGHAQNMGALTGCTAVLCMKGAIGGVDQRGGAPGTRETDLLRPMHLVEQVHAVLLSGGSAYGLDAASGVMRYLEENNVGLDLGVSRVPIVASAVLFDLNIGDAHTRPDAKMGYNACLDAKATIPLQGSIGAGTGATIGKIFGSKSAMKSGIGTASVEIAKGVIVGAIVAVNAFGDVIDPQDGLIIAGARSIRKGPFLLGATNTFANTMETMRTMTGRMVLKFAKIKNTTIGVVATNARLTKEEVNKVAQMAQNGLAKTISPAHTMLDGDTIFTMATNEKKSDVNIIGAYAAQTVARAIINAVKYAEPAGGLPSISQNITLQAQPKHKDS